MKSISVSTDVFARIWALREPKEDTEDSILRRILGCPPLENAPVLAAPQNSNAGFYDARHRTTFSEGFEIFRTYLGTEYRARASCGRWVLDHGSEYGSLNELSRAIGAKTENAWINWFFKDEFGRRRPVSDLRDAETVAARRKGNETSMSEATFQVDLTGDNTWRDDVRIGLEKLGGRSSLHRIYETVRKIRKAAGRSVPVSLDATIRRTLEDHSSDSDNYRGGLDLFCMPEGKGAGVWALRT